MEKDIYLNLDTAIPLGIIVNELISNSFKHAFRGRDNGEIRIKLHREEIGSNFKSVNEKRNGNTFALTISDNGVGIPANLDIEALDSLGLQLVMSLIDQIDAELEIKRDKGTEFTIKFTFPEKDNQAATPVKQQSF